jgi:D-alanyl-D-alanine carboxypeptidase
MGISPAARSPGVLMVGLLVVIAAITVLGHRVLASSPSTSAAPIEVVRGKHHGALGAPHGEVARQSQRRGAEADGAVPDGTTVFDDWVPGVANLDPDLLRAVREAATAGAADGVEFFVDSGWRSPAYQQHLLDDAVSKYGSVEEAARWVATPDTSAHVKGDAVDIGHSNAATWLAQHGAQYGLCQIYGNEPWHFEMRPEAISHGCPAMYTDPTHDPRMQR